MSGTIFNYRNQKLDVNPVYLNRWYPVHAIEHVDKDKPHAIEIMGYYYVLWWDKNTSQWCAHKDECPHRLTSLSSGRLTEEGHLQCAFHGRQYDSQGHCVKDPWIKKTERLCNYPGLTNVPLKLNHGLFFLFVGDSTLAEQVPLIELEPHTNPENYLLSSWYVRDSDISYISLCENITDGAHLPFVHHGSASERSFATLFNIDIKQLGPHYFKSYRNASFGGKGQNQQITFLAPCHIHRYLEYKFGIIENVYFFVPVNLTTSRIFQMTRLSFNIKILKYIFYILPTFVIHTQGADLLDQDFSILFAQARNYEKHYNDNLMRQMHCTYVDKYPNIVLKTFEKMGGPFLNSTRPPPAAPVDRMSHIQHCIHCTKAMTRLNQYQYVMVGVIVFCLFYAIYYKPMGWTAALTLTALLIWGVIRHQLHRILFIPKVHRRERNKANNFFYLLLKFLSTLRGGQKKR